MSLYVLARRTIVYQQPTASEATVIFVPNRDQIQVVRDAAGTGKTVASAAASAGGKTVWRGPQLFRTSSGQRYIYGYLPREIFEISQRVKVWLPEDLAPPEAEAFFYILSAKVIIHGTRERSDEGQLFWRSAQLSLPEDNTLGAIRQAIGDYTLANPQAVVTIAVSNQLDLYNRLKEQLAVYNLIPLPITKLKPRPNFKPLYQHYNLTMLYMLLMAIGGMCVAAITIYWWNAYASAQKTTSEIEVIKNNIAQITINAHTNFVNQPEQIFANMGEPLPISLSAVVEAGARAAKTFGDIEVLKFTTNELVNDKKELVFNVTINKPIEPMLLGQEQQGKSVLAGRPWIRSLERNGQNGERMDLKMNIQIQGNQALLAANPADIAPVKPQNAAEQPTLPSLPPETEASPTSTLPPIMLPKITGVGV